MNVVAVICDGAVVVIAVLHALFSVQQRARTLTVHRVHTSTFDNMFGGTWDSMVAWLLVTCVVWDLLEWVA